MMPIKYLKKTVAKMFRLNIVEQVCLDSFKKSRCLGLMVDDSDVGDFKLVTIPDLGDRISILL